MPKFKFRILYLFLLLLSTSLLLSFTIISGDDTIIQINDHKIGLEEFTQRLNDLPLPQAQKYSIDELKENLACTLIAETILSLEAKKENLDKLTQIRLMSNEFKDEALYEQWMNSEVRSKIRITNAELEEGCLRLKENRLVDYWTSPSRKEAYTIRKNIMDRMHSKYKHASKELEYGESLENIENLVYNMKIGEVSKPILVDSLYYIFKLIKKIPDPKYSKQDFSYCAPIVEQRLRTKKEGYLLSAKLDVLMRNKGFTVEAKAYKFLLDQLYPTIYNNDQLKYKQAEIVQQEIAAKEILPADMFNQPLILFNDGRKWTVADVWKKISVCPYPLNYKNPNDLKPGLLVVIKDIVLLNSIANDAKSKEYEDTHYVQYQSQMWDNNLLALTLIGKYRNSILLSKKDLIAYYDTTKNNFIEPERRKIIPIIVRDKKQADMLYHQIKSGKNILTLAQKYSLNKINLFNDNPGIYITPDNWGDAGRFAFTMKPGQISPPRKIDDSTYAIIKVLEIKRARPYPYEQVKNDIKSALRDQELQQKLNDLLLQKVKKYNIRIYWAELNNVPYYGGNMGVKKTHFPLRNAIPSFPLFNHNAKWFKEGVSKN